MKGKISKTTLGDDVLELMRDGVVNKMSIGFSIIKADDDESTGIRYLREVKLWEFSPVIFPANEAAVITAVKHLTSNLSQAGREALGIHEPETTHGDESQKAKADPEIIQSLADFRDAIKNLKGN